jgi:membrane protein DedA with SNARE-associated domain
MDLSTIQPVLDWIARHPELAGLVVFLVAAGESLALVGIVVPGVVFMLGIGALVGLNAIDLWQALLWAAAGAVVGDWVSYWLGRHFDQQLRHVWPLSRYPKLIPQGEKFFERHGGASIFFGRFVGPLRPIVPAVAGIMHMPQGKFYVINVVSAILWAPVVILPGVAFGESIQLASEVFFRLIAVIVILIVVAVVLGYFTKVLVSYALMASIETLGDYFGFRTAKENIVSLSLMAVLGTGVLFFVHQYEISYQPIADKQQAVNKQWWYDHWNDFSNAPLKFESQYPLTVQWRGDMENIKSFLNDNGWITAPEFNVKNSLNYFLPEPKFGQLPVWANTLFNNKEALVMLAPGMNNNKFYVLRLWAVNPNVDKDKIQLWVGAVHSIDILSVFNLLHLPVSRNDYTESLALLHSKIHATTPPLLIRQELYTRMGITDSREGEVLLLEFPGANNSPSENSGATNSSLQEVGNTGLYLKYPKSFVLQDVPGDLGNAGQQPQQSSYELRDNGVVANVSYVSNVSANLTLNKLRQQIRHQLYQLEGIEGLEITEFPAKLGDVDGIHMIARYDMPPFDKQVAYHVLAAIDDDNVWRLTVSLKDCDAKGQRRVDDMLASIAILP